MVMMAAAATSAAATWLTTPASLTLHGLITVFSVDVETAMTEAR